MKTQIKISELQGATRCFSIAPAKVCHKLTVMRVCATEAGTGPQWDWVDPMDAAEDAW